MGSQLSSWHAHTVAGLVLNAHGELPSVGTLIEIEGMRFLVDEVEHNRIRRLILEQEYTEKRNNADVATGKGQEQKLEAPQTSTDNGSEEEQYPDPDSTSPTTSTNKGE